MQNLGDIYLADVSRHPLLTSKEEQQLIADHYANPREYTAHRLIVSNLRLVVFLAGKMPTVSVSFLDLVQEGNRGLVRAVQSYDPTSSAKFSTYASYWIKSYMLKYSMDHRSQVRIGTSKDKIKLFYNLEKEKQRLLMLYGVATPAMLANTLDVNQELVIEIQGRLGADVSIYDHDNDRVKEYLLDDNSEPAEVIYEKNQSIANLNLCIEEMKQTMNERDLYILTQRVLADDPVTFKQIGLMLSVSKQRAAQLEVALVRRIRKLMNERGMK